MAYKEKQAVSIRVLRWPTPQEYNEAVQNAATSFADAELKAGSPALTPHGLPRPITGAFASVYRLHCEDRDWAVRCFLRNFPDQQERYARISEKLNQARLPYTVQFDFLDEGVRLHGQWFPILKMQWADGQHLTEFVERNLGNKSVLDDCAEKVKLMTRRLREHGIAHGDLQHGNVLVDNVDFKLVDYDGMYVPELSGLVSNELGHRNYQHPARTKDDFGPYLDNFSAWVLYASLKCVSIDPDLWRQLRGGDECMLFRQADFADPRSSLAFYVLEKHSSSEVRRLAKTLRYFTSLPLQDVPDLDQAPPEPVHLPPLLILEGSISNASGPLPDWLDSSEVSRGQDNFAPGGRWQGSVAQQQTASGKNLQSVTQASAGSTAGNQSTATTGQSVHSTSSSGGAKIPKLPPITNSASRTNLWDVAAAVLGLVLVMTIGYVTLGVLDRRSDIDSPSSTTIALPVEQIFGRADRHTQAADGDFSRSDYQSAASLYELAKSELADLVVREVSHEFKERERRYAYIDSSLGSCYMHMKQYDKAQESLNFAVKEASNVFGPESREVALDLSDLGTTMFQRGDYEAAKIKFMLALDVMQKRINPPDQHVATVLRNLGLVCQREGQYIEAAQFFNRSLTIYETSKSADKDEQIVRLLNDLGYNYQCMGNKKEVSKIRERIRKLKLSAATKGNSGSESKQTQSDSGQSYVVGSVNYEPYMAAVQTAIKKQWHPPKMSTSKDITVEFQVHKDGSVSGLKAEGWTEHFSNPLAVGTKNDELYNSAIKAVRDAAPFPSLPRGAPDKIKIQYTFRYNVFKP